MKMNSTKKTVYKLENSFFYRLRNKTKLEEFLGVPPKYFRYQQYKDDIEYNIFNIPKPNGDYRTIHNPFDKLKKLQKKILKYMARIETPNWLISGKRGSSYIDNARFHKQNEYVYTADIKQFYDNCSRGHVFEMFVDTFKMADDIAGIMTDLLVLVKCLPTGAPTSQLIAYWTYNKVFNNIDMIAKKYNSKFSLYVDDMTFSSPKPISKKMLSEIEHELNNVSLELKKAKTKYYTKKNCKLITGAALDKDKQLRVPNKIRKAIIDDWIIFRSSNGEIKKTIAPTLKGRIISAQQIESNIFNDFLNKVIKLDI